MLLTNIILLRCFMAQDKWRNLLKAYQVRIPSNRKCCFSNLLILTAAKYITSIQFRKVHKKLHSWSLRHRWLNRSGSWQPIKTTAMRLTKTTLCKTVWWFEKTGVVTISAKHFTFRRTSSCTDSFTISSEIYYSWLVSSSVIQSGTSSIFLKLCLVTSSIIKTHFLSRNYSLAPKYGIL